SGRVPTDKGYRPVRRPDRDVKPLSAAERRAILEFLESGVDLDDVLRRGVRLLAQLTRQVAVVQYPRCRHRRCVTSRCGPHAGALLMVLITDSGRVDHRMVR
ncbi:heat-inducible transcriptional repressor HrcA, partial [Rhodococcus hoagii]|nr:heat-inducible transcriptional repressor HrcA [Prescottella equi]